MNSTLTYFNFLPDVLSFIPGTFSSNVDHYAWWRNSFAVGKLNLLKRFVQHTAVKLVALHDFWVGDLE